jgi:hypothetical protein
MESIAGWPVPGSLKALILTAKSPENMQKMATLREACQCAVVQAPVGHLDMSRSAPRLNDQKNTRA